MDEKDSFSFAERKTRHLTPHLVVEVEERGDKLAHGCRQAHQVHRGHRGPEAAEGAEEELHCLLQAVLERPNLEGAISRW